MGAFKSRACEVELTGEPKKKPRAVVRGAQAAGVGRARYTVPLRRIRRWGQSDESGDGAKVTKQGCARPQHGGVWRQSRRWLRPARVPSQDALLSPSASFCSRPFRQRAPPAVRHSCVGGGSAHPHTPRPPCPWS
eukprot:scaffold6558_cov136-Isochrysis_galbana.AAC.5